jgi:hypothetical protein
MLMSDVNDGLAAAVASIQLMMVSYLQYFLSKSYYS